MLKVHYMTLNMCRTVLEAFSPFKVTCSRASHNGLPAVPLSLSDLLLPLVAGDDSSCQGAVLPEFRADLHQYEHVGSHRLEGNLPIRAAHNTAQVRNALAQPACVVRSTNPEMVGVPSLNTSLSNWLLATSCLSLKEHTVTITDRMDHVQPSIEWLKLAYKTWPPPWSTPTPLYKASPSVPQRPRLEIHQEGRTK